MTERAASALLQIKRGDGSWLIPEPIRSTGTAAQIVAAAQWDHKHPYKLGGDTSPQNIQPLAALEHKFKTRRDRKNIAKANKIEKKHEEFRNQLLAKETNEPTYSKRTKRKQITEYTRLKHLFKRKTDGTVVPR